MSLARSERFFFDDKKKLEHDSIWDLHQPFLFLFIRLFLFDIIRFDSSFGEEINQIHEKQNCKVGKFWNAVKNCSLTESISSDKVKWKQEKFCDENWLFHEFIFIFLPLLNLEC